MGRKGKKGLRRVQSLVGGVAQVVTLKREALRSNPSTTKKRKKLLRRVQS
jgi:hypothetical protein